MPIDQPNAVLAGAYDLHSHPSPDIVPRSEDIVEAARGYAEHGCVGFVVKCHAGSTAAACQLVSDREGAGAIGSITLNRPVGGLNAGAVEVAALLGARVVWLPTVDSTAQRRAGTQATGSAPVWLHLQDQMSCRAGYGGPVAVLEDGGVVAAVHEVLEVVAEYGLLLATGHLDRDEVFAVQEAAKQHGIERILVTHPDLPRQCIDRDAQTELARRGAWIERTMNALLENKLAPDDCLRGIQGCGVGGTILTGDLGQPAHGRLVNGLLLWERQLRHWNLEELTVRQLLSENPRAALGL